MAKTAQEKLDAKREKQYYKKHKKMYRTTPGDVIFNILNYTFFGAFTITCIFPFYYLFINTVSDNDLVKKGLVNFYPKGFNIDKTTSFMRRLSNSISIEYNEQEKNKDGFFREAEIVKYAFTKTQGRCIYCGKKLYVTNEKDTYQLISGSSLDHLIPASCLGLCVKGNIALACKDCNEKRGNVSPEIFFNYLHLHRKPTLYDTIDELEVILDDKQKEKFNEVMQLFYNTEEYYFALAYSLGVKYGKDLEKL